MSVFVGLDCGGSSSRVLAVNDSGEVLFQGQSGAANLVTTPEGRLRRNLISASRGCPQPQAVCGCFAGLINEHQRERAISILSEIFGTSGHLRAEPDYTAALYASDNADICVISGTGSLVCSQANSKIVKSGGRGYVLGDEGSGFRIGREFLVHFLNHPSEVSAQAKDVIAETFASTDEAAIVSGVYRAPSPATALAKLAKVCGKEAAAGSEYAVKIVSAEMTSLADILIEHARTHHSSASNLSVSLAGGVWKSNSVFAQEFSLVVQQKMPETTWSFNKLTKPPLHGAIALAKLAG